MATRRRSLTIFFAFLTAWSALAQEAENPFGDPAVQDDAATKGFVEPGSVTFAFDGGTLRCTFGMSNPGADRHIALIVVPTSVGALTKLAATPIQRDGGGSIVLATGSDGKLTQLTRESVDAWAKARIGEMSGRQTSVAENSFVAAVVHSLSTQTPVKLWAFDAQVALESGNWCKLFDPKLAEKSIDSFDNDFDGDPFK